MDPLVLLAYFVISLLVLAIAYFVISLLVLAISYWVMVWIKVPPIPTRIIILVFALLIVIWFLQNSGVVHVGGV